MNNNQLNCHFCQFFYNHLPDPVPCSSPVVVVVVDTDPVGEP